MSFADKILVVIVGPTATGKTDLTINLAQSFDSLIISADSRQFYREMQIGTSRPTKEEMKGVKHFFIGHLSVTDYYSAGRFELDVIAFLKERFLSEKIIFMTGGSGLYINAVCHGIDDTPAIDMSVRKKIVDLFIRVRGRGAVLPAAARGAHAPARGSGGRGAAERGDGRRRGGGNGGGGRGDQETPWLGEDFDRFGE